MNNDKFVPCNINYFDKIEAKNIDWLWYPYIPYGKITIVQGDPGEGKTTFVLNIAALISNGLPMPESNVQRTVARVIYQSTEDGLADTVKPRLISAGANCANIAYIDDAAQPLTLDDPRIEDAIIQSNAKMLVLDPLQAFIGTDADMHRANDMRPLMNRLSDIAERTGCAIVIIGHMNKAMGAKGLYRGLGSIDITAAARSILLVGRLKDDPTIRVMTHLKSSLAPEGSSIAFELDADCGFRWIGNYDVSAEDILIGSKPIDESKRSQAETLLRQLLMNGEILCSDIYDACHKQGIKERTVDSAKKVLGIKSIKRPDGWYWSMKI